MLNLYELRDELLAKIKASNNGSSCLYDLGCGQNLEDGFIGIDLSAKGERIRNVNLYKYPWDIESGSVDYFRASHFLEHVPDWDAHFTEVYRCLKPGGYYEIISPYYLNNRWVQDPDHKQPILQERFMYLSRDWLKINKNEHRDDLAQVNFEVIGWFELLNDDFRDQGFADDFIRWHKMHSWNVIDDVALVLKKIPME